MAIKPIPDGYTTVTPWLISRDTARLIAYVTEAFGATEISRLTSADGRVEHAEVRIGDAIVMMFDAAPDWPPTPRLPAPLRRGRRRGAPQGSRGRRDLGDGSDAPVLRRSCGAGPRPAGQHLVDPGQDRRVSLQDMERRLSDPAFTEAMRYVQSADFFGPQASPENQGP